MSIAPVTPPRTARVKMDTILAAAEELARSAAIEDADQPNHVGAHLGSYMVGERLAAHTFACEMRGYVGWEWTVTLARVPRGRVATVCEVHLLPTQEAILAPEWLPWAERLQPGDIGPGDVMPFKADDPRLVEGYKATGNEQEDQVAIEELALARTRILSETGRDEAASRWYDGNQGPRSQGSLQSAANCGSCGFLVPLQGALGQVFGVCANLWSDDDGKVVALGHGCGAHSETDVPHRSTDWPENNPIIDETAIEPVTAEQLAALAPLPEESAQATEGVADVAGDGADADAGAVDVVEVEATGTGLDAGATEVAGVDAVDEDSAAVEQVDVSESAEAVSKPRKNNRNKNSQARGKGKNKGNKAVKSESSPGKGASSDLPESDSNLPAQRTEVSGNAESLVLDLPPAKEREPRLSREQALENLNAIAQSLPQRGTN